MSRAKNRTKQTQVAEPTPQATPPRVETVTERLRREAAEAAEAERAKLAAEREKREAEEAARREREARAKAEREAAAKREAAQRAAAARQYKISHAHRLRAGHAQIVAKAESTFVHLDKMLAAMLAYEADRKAGKADGLGPYAPDFDAMMQNLASMKSQYRDNLLRPADMICQSVGGWKIYQTQMAEIAEGEALEFEAAARREEVAA